MFLHLIISNTSLDVWATAAGVFTLLATAICLGGMIVQWRESRHKALSYKIVTDAPLTSLEEVRGIQFDADRVKDTRLIVLKLWNAGNTTIKPKDYIEPIKVQIEKGIIVSSSIRNTQKETPIHLRVTSEGKAVEFPAIQLNPEESITINILLKGPQGEITTQGRIAGIMEIIGG